MHASPAVRRIAREQGISLETLQGTGPDGRITKGAERCHELPRAMCPAASACNVGGITAFPRVPVDGVLCIVPLTLQQAAYALPALIKAMCLQRTSWQHPRM